MRNGQQLSNALFSPHHHCLFIPPLPFALPFTQRSLFPAISTLPPPPLSIPAPLNLSFFRFPSRTISIVLCPCIIAVGFHSHVAAAASALTLIDATFPSCVVAAAAPSTSLLVSFPITSILLLIPLAGLLPACFFSSHLFAEPPLPLSSSPLSYLSP